MACKCCTLFQELIITSNILNTLIEQSANEVGAQADVRTSLIAAAAKRIFDCYNSVIIETSEVQCENCEDKTFLLQGEIQRNNSNYSGE